MYRRKRQSSAPFVDELRLGGLRHQPLVWSCYGRAHVEPLDTLQGLARTAARRLGMPDWRPLFHRARCAISVEIQRRIVAQVRRCMPGDPLDASAPDVAPLRTRVPESEEEAAAVATPATPEAAVATPAASSGATPPAPSALSRPAALRLVFGRGPSRGTYSV